MKSNKDVLGSVIKTAQMGVVGIQSVAPYAVNVALQEELRSEKREYARIAQLGHEIATARGWDTKELPGAAKLFSNVCARSQLMFGRTDSKIAAMMINGNTKGVIKGLKNMHHAPGRDHAVATLSQKLLDTENENIRKLQGYV